MTFPVVDLATPTGVVLHWGWLLVTNATFVVLLLLLLVFLLGITVREPGVRGELERVRDERAAGATDSSEEER